MVRNKFVWIDWIATIWPWDQIVGVAKAMGNDIKGEGSKILKTSTTYCMLSFKCTILNMSAFIFFGSNTNMPCSCP